MKPKKCKNKECLAEFTPKHTLQAYCCAKCTPKVKRTKLKQNSLKTDVIKSNQTALNHNDLINLLRIVFNAYIRERDKGKSCISCNKTLTEDYDAGHYYPVSSYPNLRFNEDNVHGQCKSCNQFNDGNTTAYLSGLVKRIGQKRVELLEAQKNQSEKLYSIDISPLIILYREKIEKLKEKTK